MANGMDTALIAASASITVGLIAAYASVWQGKRTRDLQQKLADERGAFDEGLAKTQHSLDKALDDFRNQVAKRTKTEEAALDAEQALELFRVPLQYAAEDLGHRIDNIQRGEFLEYVTVLNRRTETAVLSTAYRFARFFATLEMLYDRAEFLRLEGRLAGDTSVLGTLAEIGKTFASDDYDCADEEDFRSSRFMIWREEQRAMGEVTRDRDRDVVVGFATFAARATGADAKWFTNFVADLKSGAAEASERLALIQSLLAQLVRALDRQSSYLIKDALDRQSSYLIKDEAGAKREPEWMRRATPDSST
jgi:hypothetical protein